MTETTVFRPSLSQMPMINDDHRRSLPTRQERIVGKFLRIFFLPVDVRRTSVDETILALCWCNYSGETWRLCPGDGSTRLVKTEPPSAFSCVSRLSPEEQVAASVHLRYRPSRRSPPSLILSRARRDERDTERAESVGWHGNSSARVPASRRSILDDAQNRRGTASVCSPLSPETREFRAPAIANPHRLLSCSHRKIKPHLIPPN